MISRILTLLVARLMFFVYDDRTEIRERRKGGRARADDHLFAAALEGEPRVVSLPVAERRVEHGDPVAEHCAKPVYGLRRQRNFRDQNDRSLSMNIDDLAQELDVHES